MSDTSARLEAIADPGKFELLVTDVLRTVDPSYAALIHTGINAVGKPIVAPLDGIGIVPGSQPPRFVMVQHTTEQKLRSKWLGSSGDLEKAEQVINAERTRTPGARLTLILSTNRVPDAQLFLDVQARATGATIDLDIWDRSRLTHFLDHTPDGQWLRNFHLGIVQKRLSHRHLADISRRSSDALMATTLDDPTSWIERGPEAIARTRTSDGEALTYAVMNSGMGKTTMASRLLSRWVSEGGFGLWIPAQVAQTCLTVEEAIDSVLHSYCPTLESSAGTAAVELAGGGRGLLLIVDDINRSDNPAGLAERILLWGRRFMQSRAANCPVRIYCPIWPQVLESMPEMHRRAIEKYAVYAGRFTRKEGGDAVLRRASLGGNPVSEIRAMELSAILGDDPLLIALSPIDEAANDSPQETIPSFIRNQLAQCAAKSSNGFVVGDYHRALDRVASAMLDQRDLLPKWDSLIRWFAGEPETLSQLRDLINQRSLCNLEDGHENGTFVFRHDRVRAFQLASALKKRMQEDTLAEDILAEPFYAEALGQALVMIGCAAMSISQLKVANPLSLFFAFRQFAQPKNDAERAVIQAIYDWLETEEGRSPSTTSARYVMQAVLSEIDAPAVLDIVPRFAKLGWSADYASFRNGNIARGAAICSSADPGTGWPYRDALIRHVFTSHRSMALTALAAQLGDASLSPRIRVGTLYLAGFVADSEMHEAIKACWLQYGHEDEYFSAFLWAASECAREHAEDLIGAVCDRWASLPKPTQDHANRPHRSTPYDHGLHFGFQRQVPTAAIPYLLKRAERDDLRWEITLLLEHVDHPDVVVFIANERARVARSVKDNGGYSPWLSGSFGRREDVPFSPESRQRLYAMWTDAGLDEFVRDRALELWSKGAKLSDLAGLSTLSLTGRLADRLLVLRARLDDSSAVPDLREKIRAAKDRVYWWQFVRGFRCDEFLELIDEEFQMREKKIQPSWEEPSYSTDWPVSEVIMQLAPTNAEAVLSRHWKHLQYNPSYVQAALFVATNTTRSLAASTIASCPQPSDLLKFLSQHWRFGGTEERERLTQARLEAVEPYLDLFNESEIHSLWAACNIHGVFEWRRAHLDHRLSKEWRSRSGLDEQDLFAELDAFAASDNEPWIEHWLQQFDDRGEPFSRALGVVKGWLAMRNSLASLRIAARAIALRGNRRDLDVLNVAQVGVGADEVWRDARFAVYRRTLN